MAKTAPDPKVDFNRLRSCPQVAWPTVILFVACVTVIGGVWYAAIVHHFPLWAGALINGVAAYYLFSVVHDSSHNSLSRYKPLNELLGRIGLVYFAPLAPMDVARFIHMSHHRFTNDPERDPDSFAHRMDIWWPLRWTNFDYFYLRWFLLRGGDFARRKYPAIAAYAAFILAASATITWLGYGRELFWLWLVATRVNSVLFVIVFIFLPHHPFETTAKEDEYKATALRMGGEWLLTPLMAFHNYHLIHHLYPSAPFYNYIKIMRLKEQEILAREPLMPPPFGLAAQARGH
ncbi:MAG: hypothetical protein RIS94_2061 [Pseudomonadota bacterium]